MSPADPAVDRLVNAACHAPAGLIARLLESEDLRETRLEPEAGQVIDPVTHDPAW